MSARVRLRTRALPAALGVFAAGLLAQPLATLPAYAGMNCDGPLPMGDCTPPESEITDSPANPSESTAASFEFSTEDPEGGVTFECRLEKGAGFEVEDWTDCTTPADPLAMTSSGSKLYTGLVVGTTYTFLVRATDRPVIPMDPPNTETTPATFTWTVVEPVGPPDDDNPETTITGAGDRWHAYSYIGLEYAADEETAGFRCTLNGTEQSCDNSGQTVFYRMRHGDYTFTVAAVDEMGNVDPTPATHHWTVPRDDARIFTTEEWKQKSARGHYEDTYSVTRKRGAYTQAKNGSFRSAALVVTKAPGYGTVEVYLEDTLLKRIRLDAATRNQRHVVELGSWKRERSGRIRVLVTSTGRDVVIDGLGFSDRR